MKKKYFILSLIILIIVVLLFVLLSNKTNLFNEKSQPLFKFLKQNELNVVDINNVEYTRYTEAGNEITIYNSETNIQQLYDKVKSIKVGKEVNYACDDNTTVYTFNMKNGDKFNVEIECNYLVVNNKRYEIIK